jgi:hypothetical protein
MKNSNQNSIHLACCLESLERALYRCESIRLKPVPVSLILEPLSPRWEL